MNPKRNFNFNQYSFWDSFTRVMRGRNMHWTFLFVTLTPWGGAPYCRFSVSNKKNYPATLHLCCVHLCNYSTPLLELLLSAPSNVHLLSFHTSTPLHFCPPCTCAPLHPCTPAPLHLLTPPGEHGDGAAAAGRRLPEQGPQEEDHPRRGRTRHTRSDSKRRNLFEICFKTTV